MKNIYNKKEFINKTQRLSCSKQFKDLLFKNLKENNSFKKRLKKNKINIKENQVDDFVFDLASKVQNIFESDDDKIMEFLDYYDKVDKNSIKSLENNTFLKKKIRTVLDDYVPNSNRADRIQGSLIKQVKKSLEVVFLEEDFCLDSNSTQKDKEILYIKRFGSFIDFSKNKHTKIKFIKKMISLDIDGKSIEKIIKSFNKISLLNLHENINTRSTQKYEKRLIYSILKIIYNISDGPNFDVETTIIDYLELIYMIYSDLDYSIYMCEMDNDIQILSGLFEGVKQNKLSLSVFTCPDYKKEKVSQSTNYNLGDGAGVVGKKAVGFVSGIHQKVSSFIDEENINIKHFMPTFEFNGTEKSKQHKDKFVFEDTHQKLNGTLNSISKAYENQNIDVDMKLSKDYISDEKFNSIVKYYKNYFYKNKNTQEVKTLIYKIYNKRKKLYSNWYPQKQNETQKEYEDRLEKVIIRQMAEYGALGKVYSNGKDSDILLLSDSRAMYHVNAYLNQAVLFGQAK